MKIAILSIFVFCSTLFAQEVYSTFNVESIKESDLTLSASGVVYSVGVEIGDEVKKGQKLLELDNREEEIALALAISEAEEAKISYEYAKRNYQRYLKLKNIVEDEFFEKVELEMISKKKMWEIKKNRVSLKKTILDRTYLKAPYDGVILDKYVEAGDGVAGAQDKLIKISKRPDVKLLIEFDQKYWDLVKSGDVFEYRVDGVSGERSAKITKIYPSVNPKNRKLKAEAIASDLLPGLFGDGIIITE